MACTSSGDGGIITANPGIFLCCRLDGGMGGLFGVGATVVSVGAMVSFETGAGDDDDGCRSTFVASLVILSSFIGYEGLDTRCRGSAEQME